jgi:hypothetical protein
LRKQKLHGGIKRMAEEAIKLGGKKKSKFIDKFRVSGHGSGRHGSEKIFAHGCAGDG